MTGIDHFIQILDMVFYVAIGLGAIGFGVFYSLKKSGYFNKRNNKEVSYKNAQKKDTLDYLNFEDIRDGIIITNNFSTFISGVKTNGVDYFNNTKSEQGRVITGYIEYINSITGPTKMFVQAAQDDVSGYLEFFKELKENKSKEIMGYKETLQQLGHTLKTIEKTDLESHNMVIEKIQKLERSIENAQWQLERIKHKEHIVRHTSSNEVRDKSESYIFVQYDYTSESLGVTLEKNEILYKAKQSLDIQIQNIMRSHKKIGVDCRKLTSDELGKILRSAFNPLDGDQVEFNQLLNSNTFSLYSTGDTPERIKKEALLEQIELNQKQRPSVVEEEVEANAV